MRSKRRCRGSFYAAALVALGVLVSWGTTAASAQNPNTLPPPGGGGGSSYTVTFYKTSSASTNPVLTGVTTPASFTCTTSVDYPHSSGHNPGTANVESHVSCNFFYMNSVTLQTQLWYSGYYYAGRVEGNYGLPYLNSSAQGTCHSGGYQGKASAVLEPPAGYEPSIFQTPYVQSPVIYVACS